MDTMSGCTMDGMEYQRLLWFEFLNVCKTQVHATNN